MNYLLVTQVFCKLMVTKAMTLSLPKKILFMRGVWRMCAENSKILEAVYEPNFCGFSYGFRRGRGQHDALDALAVGISKKKIDWVYDADIEKFFDSVDHSWLEKFIMHKVADKRMGMTRDWQKRPTGSPVSSD